MPGETERTIVSPPNILLYFETTPNHLYDSTLEIGTEGELEKESRMKGKRDKDNLRI
jgi:hypothetical protein